jgi:hypothetical protein
MRKTEQVIIKLESYQGNDASLRVDTTGHPDTDVMFCVVTIFDGDAVDVHYGYRTLAEAQEVRKSASRELIHDNYFGTCPRCHQTDGYVNVGASHWFVCDKHKTKWFIGENLFSSAMDETLQQQRERLKKMGFDSYEEVEPFRVPDPEE